MEKTISGILEKDILFREKKYFFRRSKLENCQKKKDETKRRRKTKGVSQRDEKREWKKATTKKHKDLAKK